MSETELKQIMYVEDEPDIRAVIKIALENIGGFDVVICSSGEEALAKVDSYQPQLILLDVMMPGMDGPTTLEKLRLKPVSSQIPIIFLTAKVQPKEINQLKTLGALDVIAKPIDPMTLADSIKNIWGKYYQQSTLLEP